MKVIQLQYPDQTHDRKIVDDLTVLSRNTGQAGHRARAAFDDTALPGMRTKLVQRSVPLADAVEPGDLPEDQVIVEDGDTIVVTGGSVVVTVAGGAITGGTYTPD